MEEMDFLKGEGETVHWCWPSRSSVFGDDKVKFNSYMSCIISTSKRMSNAHCKEDQWNSLSSLSTYMQKRVTDCY